MSLPRLATLEVAGGEVEPNAFGLQDAGDSGGNVIILARNETRRQLTTVTSLPKRAVDLGELEPDIAPADNDQVRRKLLDIQQGAVR